MMTTRRPLLAAALIIAWPLAAMPLTGAAFAQQTGSTDGGQAPADDQPPADQPPTDQPQVDTHQTPDFAAFWQRFTTAVKANDRKQLQLMTELPFDFAGQHYAAAQFGKLADGLYDKLARRCLAGETPVFDQGIYEVFCGELIYVFTPIPGLTPEQAAKILDGSAWRLSEIGAND
jgi:hypothetical protein